MLAEPVKSTFALIIVLAESDESIVLWIIVFLEPVKSTVVWVIVSVEPDKSTFWLDHSVCRVGEDSSCIGISVCDKVGCSSDCIWKSRRG